MSTRNISVIETTIVTTTTRNVIVPDRVEDTQNVTREQMSEEQLQLLNDLKELLIYLDMYLTARNYYLLYVVEVKIHKELKVVPQNWFYYWVFRRRSLSWKWVVAFYLVFFVAYTTLTGVVTVATGPQALYKMEGFSCNSLNGEGFTYYIQAVAGMCNTTVPQSFDSESCILWSDTEFWAEFESKLTESRRSKASAHAEELSFWGKVVYRNWMWIGLLTTILRPIEALLNLFFNAGCFSQNLKNLVFAIVTFISNLFTILVNSHLGVVGREDENAPFIPENWESYYGCGSVERTKLAPYYKYYFDFLSLSIIWLLSFPELGNHFWTFLCCKKRD